MRALEIRDLKRKETPLHYRREYSGVAVLEGQGRREEVAVSFIVEHQPLGGADVTVSLGADPRWPLVPVVNSIKHLVRELEQAGNLP